MAAAGYMTEEDTESIWDTVLDTDRFSKVNVRLGEIVNFHVRPDRDATTDVTETKVLPILEQLCEEALIDLITSAKTIDHPRPVEYVMTHAVGVMNRLFRQNYWTIRAIKELLGAKVIVKYSDKLNLPSHKDND